MRTLNEGPKVSTINGDDYITHPRKHLRTRLAVIVVCWSPLTFIKIEERILEMIKH